MKKKSLTEFSSVVTLLKTNNDSVNDQLLTLINSLSLEDLIALKLELSSRLINNRLYGFDLWRNTNKVVKEALLKYAIATTKSKKDASRFLGIDYRRFNNLLKEYQINKYYNI